MLLFFAAMACAPEEVEAEVGFVANGCGAVAALQADRRWVWSSAEGAETQAEWESEVRVLRDISARIWTSGSVQSPKLSQDYSRTSEYQCEAGAWLLSEETQEAGLDGGVAFSHKTLVQYDEPVLVWPADVQNGDTWQSHYVGTAKTDGVSTPIDYTVDYRVKAPADLDVEAGTFHAFQVVANDGTTEWRFWVAREAGVVKGPDYELTALW